MPLVGCSPGMDLRRSGAAARSGSLSRPCWSSRSSIPLFVRAFAVTNITYFLVWVFMALGLWLIWGYGGILSFGQTAFFGLAGYAYGVIAINLGDSRLADAGRARARRAASARALAVVLGYFMFYGGVRDVFVGIVTLSITLVFETFMAQTAGPEWRIGSPG